MSDHLKNMFDLSVDFLKQIKIGYIDAATSEMCPPLLSRLVFFKDYDLRYGDGQPRIKNLPEDRTTGTISISENDLPE